jgi:hypothetical protein
MATQSTLIDPSTGKPYQPGAKELFVEVTALEVYNAGSAYSSDQVVFKCPFCHQRQRQNIRRAVAFAQGKGSAAFRCICRRLVYVRKPVTQNKRSLISSPYTR